MAIRPLRLTPTETIRPQKATTVIIHPQRETTHLLAARVANIRLTALSSKDSWVMSEELNCPLSAKSRHAVRRLSRAGIGNGAQPCQEALSVPMPLKNTKNFLQFGKA
jgi:hypothetical protein